LHRLSQKVLEKGNDFLTLWEECMGQKGWEQLG